MLGPLQDPVARCLSFCLPSLVSLFSFCPLLWRYRCIWRSPFPGLGCPSPLPPALCVLPRPSAPPALTVFFCAPVVSGSSGGQNSQLKGEAHENAPRRQARPIQPRETHTRTHARTWAWRPVTRKGRRQDPHETALVHRLSPPSKDGRLRKPDASVTWSTYAKQP